MKPGIYSVLEKLIMQFMFHSPVRCPSGHLPEARSIMNCILLLNRYDAGIQKIYSYDNEVLRLFEELAPDIENPRYIMVAKIRKVGGESLSLI